MPEQTFIFADLAGFTALTEAHGDEDAADLAAEFSAEVRDLLPDHGGQEIKSIGDAVMIRVPDASAAVTLGLLIVEQVGAQPGFPTVRVGMNTGPAVERNGDWFGACVNLAARVSGAAAGGEVLLSEATRDRAGTIEGVELRERGRHELKNISEPVLLFAAARSGATDSAGLPIDPVCRMAVDPVHSAGKLRFEGVTFHFCSLECAATFAAAPDRHART